LHDRFFHLVNHLQSPFLLFVRLYWGWQLAQSGWGKLHNLANVSDFFVSLNLPYPAETAVFISCVEFFGGIFLALGLLSRMTALVLTINMVVAYLTADREALLSVLSDPDKVLRRSALYIPCCLCDHLPFRSRQIGTGCSHSPAPWDKPAPGGTSSFEVNSPVPGHLIYFLEMRTVWISCYDES
jgi:putative oxidoreductase